MDYEKMYEELRDRILREMDNFMEYESDDNDPLYVDGFIECYNRIRNLMD